LPTVYRLYTLCSIYKLDFDEVLRWYGVPVEQIAADGLNVPLEETHEFGFTHARSVTVPHFAETTLDVQNTVHLSRFIKRWGKMPFTFLNAIEAREYRYGCIGLEDWSMYPVLHPGSVIAIDETQRKIVGSGWVSEYDRPIYFFELRAGFRCGWCTLEGSRLILEPHPASQMPAQVFECPREIEVIGRVVAVAMKLRIRKHHIRGIQN
jgi:hypothetical protein